jgi:hypothetical protein
VTILLFETLDAALTAQHWIMLLFTISKSSTVKFEEFQFIIIADTPLHQIKFNPKSETKNSSFLSNIKVWPITLDRLPFKLQLLNLETFHCTIFPLKLQIHTTATQNTLN